MIIIKRFRFKQFIIIIACLFSFGLCGKCDLSVSLKQNLLNNGMHRNLTYELSFGIENSDFRGAFDGCFVAIEQSLPAGVYYNPDEVKLVEKEMKLDMYYSAIVDVESMAHKSKPSNFIQTGSVFNDRMEVWMPLHARYQKAEEGGGFVVNVILPPSVYMFCPDDRVKTCGKFSVEITKKLCAGAHIRNCVWRGVQYELKTRARDWYTPIGNTHQQSLISFATGVCSVFALFFLVQTLHDFRVELEVESENVRKEMNENVTQQEVVWVAMERVLNLPPGSLSANAENANAGNANANVANAGNANAANNET